MEASWHSTGRRRWNLTSEDWLCLPKTRESAVVKVILYEGHHHYFKALHQFDSNGARVLDRTLDDPGPFFEFDFDNAEDGWILVRTQFLAFIQAPFQGHQAINEISCGEIHLRDGTIEPILMQVNAQVEHRPHREPQTDPDRVLRSMLEASQPPVVELVPGDPRSGENPFRMKTTAPYDTRVYLIRDEELDRSIAPGKHVSFSVFPASLPSVTIRVGQFGLASPLGGQPWHVALPVLQLPTGEGLVGQPLIIGGLIRDLTIDAFGNSVDASWTWHGPKHWVRVRLDWDFYFEEEWAETPGSMEITWQIYRTKRCVNLFERLPCRGWNLELTATPVVFGREHPSIRATESL